MSRRYIACICEGGAETAIMEILLENQMLEFSYADLFDQKIIRNRKAKYLQDEYLNFDYPKMVEVYRILDSRAENFNIHKAYKHKVIITNVITAPEIEILIIIGHDKLKEYQKSKMKPSEFCKAQLDIKNVKKPEYVREFFRDTNELKEVLKKYKSNFGKPKEITIYDLLLK